MTTPRTTTSLRRPPGLRGVPPRYEVFDRRKSPPMTVGKFYFDPHRDAVVFEVYDDVFREFLKREEPFANRGHDWILDVDPDAPHDTRAAIIHPQPMPSPTSHGDAADALTLADALEGFRPFDFYRVVRTSDPV